MKRLIFAAFAIFALAGASFAEPEPGEHVTTPGYGIVYPPPTPDNPDPPPVTVIIGDDGNLIPVDGDLPEGDNWFETALEAMTAALRAEALAQGAWNYADSAMGQANAAMRQANAAMEEAKKKGKIELGTGYAEVLGDISFDKGSATLTVPGKKVRLEKSSREGTLDIAATDGQSRTATFGKLAGKDAISEADDYADSVTAKDEKVTEDLTNLILSYHPPDEGVPDEATNILAQVAFDGDYNSLTNKPSIKVEEDEDGNITLTLVTGEDADGSMDLHTIAVSGLLSDAEDWDDLDDRITALEDHVASCQCNGGGEGGGGGEGCTCEGCGGGGCTCAAEEKQCDCQIKTAAHVNAAEVDPEAIPRVEALESRMTKVENDLATASQRLNALCEYLGKNPMPGDMNRPPDFDN